MNGVDRRFVAVLVVAIGVSALWLLLAGPCAAAQAGECRRLYSRARTQLDSVAIDATVPLSPSAKVFDPWRSCGVFRQRGKL